MSITEKAARQMLTMCGVRRASTGHENPMTMAGLTHKLNDPAFLGELLAPCSGEAKTTWDAVAAAKAAGKPVTVGSRERTITLFAGFVKRSDLTDQDLMVVAECCFRELSARGVAGTQDVNPKTMVGKLLAWQR